MSCLENERFCEYLEEMAHEDFLDENKREPTNEELEALIEQILEKYL